MRKIKVPAPVYINENIPEFTFKQWICALLDDPQLYKTPQDIRRCVKLEKQFAEDFGDELDLEDADYDALSRVYNNPSGTYHPQVARAALPFMDAFEGATK